MPDLPYQIITIGTNVVMLIFMIYYIWRLHTKETELEKKEHRIDSDYHRVVDDATLKERKIIEDATKEADQIIAGAKYISKSSQEAIDQTLTKMIEDLKQRVLSTSHGYIESYQTSLKQMSVGSLTGFQSITQALEADYHAQIKQFHDTLLPNMQKELDAYKANRLKEIEKNIELIIQKVARDVLNKSITPEDHQNLIIEALEKAKNEGTFN